MNGCEVQNKDATDYYIDILNVWYNNIVMISYPVLALFIVKNEIEIIVLFYALDFV